MKYLWISTLLIRLLTKVMAARKKGRIHTYENIFHEPSRVKNISKLSKLSQSPSTRAACSPRRIRMMKTGARISRYYPKTQQKKNMEEPVLFFLPATKEKKKRKGKKKTRKRSRLRGVISQVVITGGRSATTDCTAARQAGRPI